MSAWYSRPVIFVEDVERSIGFYTDKLGFKETSRYSENGKALVAQVDREDCQLLLNCQQPRKTDHGRMFISLDIDVLNALRAELEVRGAPVKNG
jgi:catechol 2,3-dioxygenase-like lactoylglutathione lyase family enzyme